MKRISKPVWRACKVVAAQMRQEMSYAYRSGQVPAGRLFDWEMRLWHSMDVSGRTCRRIIRRGWWIGGVSSAEATTACVAAAVGADLREEDSEQENGKQRRPS